MPLYYPQPARVLYAYIIRAVYGLVHPFVHNVDHPTRTVDTFERLSPATHRSPPVWPLLIMQRHLSEASSPSSSSLHLSSSNRVHMVSTAQLDVQHAAGPHNSVDTESNLFQSRNSIISPGPGSTIREWGGGWWGFSRSGGCWPYHKHKLSSTLI